MVFGILGENHGSIGATRRCPLRCASDDGRTPRGLPGRLRLRPGHRRQRQLPLRGGGQDEPLGAEGRGPSLRGIFLRVPFFFVTQALLNDFFLGLGALSACGVGDVERPASGAEDLRRCRATAMGPHEG